MASDICRRESLDVVFYRLHKKQVLWQIELLTLIFEAETFFEDCPYLHIQSHGQ